MIKQTITRAAATLGYHVGINPPVTDNLVAHLQVLFERFDVNLVIDVGANKGQYATSIRRIFKGRIVSIEPGPEAAMELRAAAASDPAWQIMQVALGAQNTEAELHQFGPNDLNSLLPASETGRTLFGVKFAEVGTLKVPVRTLESLWDEIVAGINSPRVYLKIDTQGYDFQVLEGAKAILPHVVAMQSEISWQPLYEGAVYAMEALRRFDSMDFVPSAMFPVNCDRNLRSIEMDCVLVRR